MAYTSPIYAMFSWGWERSSLYWVFGWNQAALEFCASCPDVMSLDFGTLGLSPVDIRQSHAQ